MNKQFDVIVIGGGPGGYIAAIRAAQLWLWKELKLAVEPAAALGLDGPALPMPWSILSLLSAGPALSQADALTAADFTAPAPNPTENR